MRAVAEHVAGAADLVGPEARAGPVGDAAIPRDARDDVRGVGAGLDQAHVQFAVAVTLDHIGDADGGQGAGFGKALAPALAQPAFGLQLADRTLEVGPVTGERVAHAAPADLDVRALVEGWLALPSTIRTAVVRVLVVSVPVVGSVTAKDCRRRSPAAMPGR